MAYGGHSRRQGGRARLIVIDRPVLDFLANIPALRHLIADYQLAEPPGHYFINDAGAIWRQIAETLHLMTPEEQQHLRDFLAREGISGFYRVWELAASGQRVKKRQECLPLCVAYDAQACWLSRSAINASALLMRSTLRDLPIA